MKKYILLFWLILSGIGFANAASFEELYKSEKYSDAALMLEKSEIKNSENLYNLGNCYYKKGDYARAILNYERALRMNPGDEDIRFNLKMAVAHTIDKIDSPGSSFLYELIDNLAGKLTAGGWATRMFVIFLLSVPFFAAYTFSTVKIFRKLGFILGLAVMGFGLFTGALSMHQVHRFSQTEAVIMEDITDVSSEPGGSGKKLFILHSGTRIKVLETRGEDTRVSLADGKQGWVKKSVYEII
jgi:hypothetical protein